MMRSTINAKGKVFQKIAIFLFWIGIWQMMYHVVGRDLYLPSPFSVFEALVELVQTPLFWKVIRYSMQRVLIGLVLSILAGIFLGGLAGLVPWFYELMKPLVIVIKSTPVISFIIIALIWFTSTNVPIFIAFLMCFPIIYTNIVLGIHHVDEKLLQMADSYGVPLERKLKMIYWPSIKPYFSASVLTALGLGWKVSVAAEVLSHPRYAIGSHLHSAKTYLDIPGLFAWTAVVIILSVIFEMLFTFWMNTQKKRGR